jgi:hypothetical protein
MRRVPFTAGEKESLYVSLDRHRDVGAVEAGRPRRRAGEETARHAGHMGIVRELLDGATGDHPEADR